MLLAHREHTAQPSIVVIMCTVQASTLKMQPLTTADS